MDCKIVQETLENGELVCYASNSPAPDAEFCIKQEESGENFSIQDYVDKLDSPLNPIIPVVLQLQSSEVSESGFSTANSELSQIPKITCCFSIKNSKNVLRSKEKDMKLTGSTEEKICEEDCEVKEIKAEPLDNTVFLPIQKNDTVNECPEAPVFVKVEDSGIFLEQVQFEEQCEEDPLILPDVETNTNKIQVVDSLKLKSKAKKFNEKFKNITTTSNTELQKGKNTVKQPNSKVTIKEKKEFSLIKAEEDKSVVNLKRKQSELKVNKSEPVTKKAPKLIPVDLFVDIPMAHIPKSKALTPNAKIKKPGMAEKNLHQENAIFSSQKVKSPLTVSKKSMVSNVECKNKAIESSIPLKTKRKSSDKNESPVPTKKFTKILEFSNRTPKISLPKEITMLPVKSENSLTETNIKTGERRPAITQVKMVHPANSKKFVSQKNIKTKTQEAIKTVPVKSTAVMSLAKQSTKEITPGKESFMMHISSEIIVETTPIKEEENGSKNIESNKKSPMKEQKTQKSSTIKKSPSKTSPTLKVKLLFPKKKSEFPSSEMLDISSPTTKMGQKKYDENKNKQGKLTDVQGHEKMVSKTAKASKSKNKNVVATRKGKKENGTLKTKQDVSTDSQKRPVVKRNIKLTYKAESLKALERIDKSEASSPLQKRRRSYCVDNCNYDEFFDKPLPEGWKGLVVQRQSGASAGKYDVYIFSPTGERFRSRREIATYLETVENHGLNLEDFRFGVSIRTKRSQTSTKVKCKQRVIKPRALKTLTKPITNLVKVKERILLHAQKQKAKQIDYSVTNALQTVNSNTDNNLVQKSSGVTSEKSSGVTSEKRVKKKSSINDSTYSVKKNKKKKKLDTSKDINVSQQGEFYKSLLHGKCITIPLVKCDAKMTSDNPTTDNMLHTTASPLDIPIKIEPVEYSVTASEATNQSLDSHQSKWNPPKSPYNIIYESIYTEPWKLLVATIIIKHSPASVGTTLVWKFFEKYPTMQSIKEAPENEMKSFFHVIEHTEKCVKKVKSLVEEFNTKPWLNPIELSAIGKYGNDAYKIFCTGEWRDVRPTDIDLLTYHGWLKQNCIQLGL